MLVHIVWHVHHFDLAVGKSHLNESGEVDFTEGVDDLKLIGVYSDRTQADAGIARVRILPGFVDEPECFYVAEYAVDEESDWTEGFDTVVWSTA